MTIERIGEFFEPARMILEQLGYENIEYHQGDGSLGYAEYAPYHGIVVTAAAPEIPQPLWEQLEENGRLVIPVGNQYQQQLLLVEKRDSKMRKTKLCDCRFVKLIGKAGWLESSLNPS